MIREVILWANGMVMVFDEHGQQMAEYQGRVDEVRDKILRDAPADAKFSGGVWREGITESSRETLAKAPKPKWAEEDTP